MAMIERKYPIFWLTKLLCRLFLMPFFKISTYGIENIPKKTGFILSPKHQRWEDIPILALATCKPLYYIAKRELFKNPVSSWFIGSLGGIPLNRDCPIESRDSFAKIIEILNQGEGVVLFPEGTYYKNKIGPGKIGVIKMIRNRLNVPFIPVGIHYDKAGYRNHVEIIFGKAVYADRQTTSSMLLHSLMENIAELSGLR